MEVAIIPALIVLQLLASVERRVHKARFVRRFGDPGEFRWPPREREVLEP